jgi:glycosyltransferase involved in cell wall biosynthesis
VPDGSRNRMQQHSRNDTRQAPPCVVLHYWGSRGGGSLFTRLLGQYLRAAHSPPDVFFSLYCGNHDMEAFEATGLTILTVDRPSLSTLWHRIWSLPKHLRMHADKLVSLKPNAVIMTMNSPFAWPFIRMLQKRGLKVFYVAHDATPHPGDYAALWQRVTQDLLIKRADGVIALSKSVAQRVAERLPAAAGKISVMSLEGLYPTKRTSLPERKDLREPVRLLFYGRLLPYKGLDRLAQALDPLRSRLDWKLTIAGAGPLEMHVREIFAGWTQVDLELGWISEERTSELFSTHHLLLCPYTEASQSGVIADALSWAMPCLVMPTGALPEQIGFGLAGIVAESTDVDGLRRSLQTVFESPNLLVELSQGAALFLAKRQTEVNWDRLIEAASAISE